jgi:ribosomal protein S15P/S13E
MIEECKNQKSSKKNKNELLNIEEIMNKLNNYYKSKNYLIKYFYKFNIN